MLQELRAFGCAIVAALATARCVGQQTHAGQSVECRCRLAAGDRERCWTGWLRW